MNDGMGKEELLKEMVGNLEGSGVVVALLEFLFVVSVKARKVTKENQVTYNEIVGVKDGIILDGGDVKVIFGMTVGPVG